MGASLDLLLDAGLDAIWHHVDGLLDDAVARLTHVGAIVRSDRSPSGRSAHLTFEVPGVDATMVCDRLEAQQVICSPRGGGVRVAPHGYNTTADIDALVEVVAGIVP